MTDVFSRRALSHKRQSSSPYPNSFSIDEIVLCLYLTAMMEVSSDKEAIIGLLEIKGRFFYP